MSPAREGEVFVTWWPVAGRGTYIAEQSTSATGPWAQVFVGRTSSCTGSGLVSGQMCFFRVRAIGAAGPSPSSDITQARAT